LVNDIKEYGYDPNQPIYLYEGEILDGWNRNEACDQLKVKPRYEVFEGSKIEAINFVMRTNKRRQITSSQWAALAVEAFELIDAIQKSVEQERREKQSKTREAINKGEVITGKTLPNKKADEKKAATKIAKLFHTNRTSFNDARKILSSNPQLHEQIKSGEISIGTAKKKENERVTLTKNGHSPYGMEVKQRYHVLYIHPLTIPSERFVKNETELSILSELPIDKMAHPDSSTLLVQVLPSKESQTKNIITKLGFKFIESIIIEHNGVVQPSRYFNQKHQILLIFEREGGGAKINPNLEKRNSIIKADQVFDVVDEIFQGVSKKIGLFTEAHDGWDIYDYDPTKEKMVLKRA